VNNLEIVQFDTRAIDQSSQRSEIGAALPPPHVQSRSRLAACGVKVIRLLQKLRKKPFLFVMSDREMPGQLIRPPQS
jgi:hypothetical protein